MELVKKNLKWIVCAVCMLITVVILALILANGKGALPIDSLTIDWILSIRTNILTSILKIVTFFGEAKLLLPVGILGAIIGFFVFKDNKRTICFGGNLILNAGLNWVIKHIIQRPRPDESLRLVTEEGYSFPSGHAMVTTAFYGLIIFFVYNNIKNKALRNAICIGLSLLIVLIDFSRVYLGVHYLTDVLSGTLISIAYLIIATEFAKKYLF